MLREKVCLRLGLLIPGLQRLFECAFCTALISELVWKRIPDGRTDDRKLLTAKCAVASAAVVSWYIQVAGSSLDEQPAYASVSTTASFTF